MTYFYFLLTGKRFQFEARECEHLQQQQQIAAGDRPACQYRYLYVYDLQSTVHAHIFLYKQFYFMRIIQEIRREKCFLHFLVPHFSQWLFFFCAVFCTVFQFLVLCIQFRIDWIFCREDSQVVLTIYLVLVFIGMLIVTY